MEKTLDLIKKLIAKGESVGPEEAAAFLGKAQELMAKHGLSHGDLRMSEIGHEKFKSTTSVSKVKPQENALVHLVCRAFGCHPMFHPAHSGMADNWARWSIVGEKTQIQVASYTAQVLLRKMANARVEFVKTLPALLPRADITKEADGFCLGWVRAVSDTVHAFANTTPDTKLAIAAYIKKTFAWEEGGPTCAIQKRQLGVDGLAAGLIEGSKVRLHHGVGANAKASALAGQQIRRLSA